MNLPARLFFDPTLAGYGAAGFTFAYANEAIWQGTLLPQASWLDALPILAMTVKISEPDYRRFSRQWFKWHGGWVLLFASVPNMARKIRENSKKK